MKRQEKVAVVEALHERFTKARVALVASNTGLSVEQSNELRRDLRAAGGELKVAKHTLTRLALEQTAYGGLSRLLEGPRGLVFGYDDPVAVAKTLVDFAEHHNKLQIDGALVEGQMIPANRVKALAEMPSLPFLRARAVRQALAPGSRIAGTVAGPAQRIAGAIAVLVQKLEGTNSAVTGS